MYFVLFFVNGTIVHTEHYDTSSQAFGDAETHAEDADDYGSQFDAIVFKVDENGLPQQIRSY